MVVIPAGRFLMGSPPGEAGRYADEGPQRWVDVPRFAIGKFEVTQGQWQAVMGNSLFGFTVRGTNPSKFNECGPTCEARDESDGDGEGVFGGSIGKSLGCDDDTDPEKDAEGDLEWDKAENKSGGARKA
jgi:hypothetical protein